MIFKLPILIFSENACYKHILVCFTLQAVRNSSHHPTFECSKKKQKTCYFRVLRNITTKLCPSHQDKQRTSCNRIHIYAQQVSQGYRHLLLNSMFRSVNLDWTYLLINGNIVSRKKPTSHQLKSWWDVKTHFLLFPMKKVCFCLMTKNSATSIKNKTEIHIIISFRSTSGRC